jgi:demethylmenaquinone methyltransferase/2-methoxy-6-polyprenyl-1,4-benzoquinol methylase
MYSKNLHREYFDSKARNWDSPQDRENFAKIVSIFREFKIDPEGYILDIGCGTGILVPLFLSADREHQNLIEMDFSAKMVQQNKKKWIHYSDKNMFHTQGDALQLPFKSESLDWIIGFAVMPHLEDKRKALREFHRVLASQGNLLILHLMGSIQLNRFHSQAGGVITQDVLQPAPELSKAVRQCGFEELLAIDQENLYLVQALKG